MADDVILYSSPMSRGRIVHWMLEETGAPYRYQVVNLELREQKQPAYLAVNPMGKVPALLHRGVVITECGAICAYLADVFAAARLAPALDSPVRGSYYRWMFFGAGCVDAAIIDRMYSRSPPSRPGALPYGSCEDTLGTLEQALAPGPYLLGAQFTAADVYLGSQLAFGIMMKAIEPRPVFQQYLSRVQQRPAYRRFTEKSEQLLAQMKRAG